MLSIILLGRVNFGILLVPLVWIKSRPRVIAF